MDRTGDADRSIRNQSSMGANGVKDMSNFLDHTFRKALNVEASARTDKVRFRSADVSDQEVESEGDFQSALF